MRHALLSFTLLASLTAAASPKEGTWVQTDTLGMNVVSYDYIAKTTKTVSDRAELSEFVGLHYYVADGWRFGLNLQFTERLTPAVPANQNTYRTFAVLPQVGWTFYDPFFAALVLTLAPYTNGASVFGTGVQGVLGASFPVTAHISVNAAIEVPFNFGSATNIGLTPLLGMSIKT